MYRIRFCIRALVIVATLAFAADLARAEGWFSIFTFNEDGTTTEVVYNFNGDPIEIWYYDENGKIIGGEIGAADPGNPDPTQGSGTGSSIEDQIDRLKNQGGPAEIPVQMFKTPLGKHLFKIGKGMVDPFHNPNPGDDVSNGGAGTGDNGGSAGDPLGGNGAGGGHGSGGGSGQFDPNGGSMAGQIKNSGKKGGNSNNEGGSGTPPGPKGEPLPGPPEPVNPPWSGGFVLVSPLQTVHGARVGAVKRHAAGPANPSLQFGAFGPGGGHVAPRPIGALGGGR